MVEAQAKRWVFKQSGRRGAPPGEWPVVTISCEFGAHGVVLGRKVAQRLGFSYWDREVVSEIARLLHMGEGTVVAFDERTRTAIEDLLAAFAPNLGATFADYVADVRGIIDAIAGRGSAVIVGREAQYLVDPRRALRVRLVAPFDRRAREIEAESKVSGEAAKRLLVAGEWERAAFVRRAVGQNVADPVHYDLAVNTDTYSGERAESVVLMAYLAKFGEWPLTAHSLSGASPADLAGILPPRDQMVDMA
ncbi:MAG: cytidylate kinase-like family protein [Polyangia bacterium]